ITLVPILCVYFTKHTEHDASKQGWIQKYFLKPFADFSSRINFYGPTVTRLVGMRWLVVIGYLVTCALVLLVLGLRVGTELFPQIDSGEFVLRFRPPQGSNFEITREMAVKILKEMQEEGG